MFFKTVLKAFRNVHLQGVLTGKRVGRYLNGGCEAKEVCHFFQKKIVDNFGSFEKKTTFALAIGKMMNGCRSLVAAQQTAAAAQALHAGTMKQQLLSGESGADQQEPEQKKSWFSKIFGGR